MKRVRFRLMVVGLLAAVGVLSSFAAAEKEDGASPADVTVITAEKLTFDYKKHYALFENNVLVTDPEMQLAADQMMVLFDEKGKAKSVKAEGRVTLRQTDKTAQAGLATYDFESGKIVLAIKPRVTRGRDMLEGEIITFWRNENRMICQPQARLVIYPEKGGVKDEFFGE
jgi:lipopolysaccharide transport protein LptA